MEVRGLLQMDREPSPLAIVLEMALAGDVDAQFAVGMIYADGRGVKRDLVQAFFWMSRAIDQGSKEAVECCQSIRSQMSSEDHERALYLIGAVRRTGFLQQTLPGSETSIH